AVCAEIAELLHEGEIRDVLRPDGIVIPLCLARHRAHEMKAKSSACFSLSVCRPLLWLCLWLSQSLSCTVAHFQLARRYSHYPPTPGLPSRTTLASANWVLNPCEAAFTSSLAYYCAQERPET